MDIYNRTDIDNRTDLGNWTDLGNRTDLDNRTDLGNRTDLDAWTDLDNRTDLDNQTFIFYDPYYDEGVPNLPFVVVGSLLNVLSLWVWQAEAKKSMTTLLFMYLAVTDSIHLVFMGSLEIAESDQLSDVTFIALTCAAELGLLISVHTTTIIALNRWFAIWRPLHVRHVMTRRRVIVACVVTSFWSVILVAAFYGPEFVSFELVFDFEQSVTYAALVIGSLLFGRIIPIVVLLLCSVSIVWMMVRNRRKIQKFSDDPRQPNTAASQSTAAGTVTQPKEAAANSSEAAIQCAAAAAQSTEAAKQSKEAAANSSEAAIQFAVATAQSTEAAIQSAAAAAQSTAMQSTAAATQAASQTAAQAAAKAKANATLRKSTLAVLCIAGVTFIAFPLGASVLITSRFASSDTVLCGDLCFLAADVNNIVTTINCGINFVFYVAFCARFRVLLKQRVSACLCCVKCTPRHHNTGLPTDP